MSEDGEATNDASMARSCSCIRLGPCLPCCLGLTLETQTRKPGSPCRMVVAGSADSGVSCGPWCWEACSSIIAWPGAACEPPPPPTTSKTPLAKNAWSGWLPACTHDATCVCLMCCLTECSDIACFWRPQHNPKAANSSWQVVGGLVVFVTHHAPAVLSSADFQDLRAFQFQHTKV